MLFGYVLWEPARLDSAVEEEFVRIIEASTGGLIRKARKMVLLSLAYAKIVNH